MQPHQHKPHHLPETPPPDHGHALRTWFLTILGHGLLGILVVFSASVQTLFIYELMRFMGDVLTLLLGLALPLRPYLPTSARVVAIIYFVAAVATLFRVLFQKAPPPQDASFQPNPTVGALWVIAGVLFGACSWFQWFPALSHWNSFMGFLGVACGVLGLYFIHGPL